MAKIDLSDLLCETTRGYFDEEPDVMCSWSASVYGFPEDVNSSDSFGPLIGHVSMYTFLTLSVRAADGESGDLVPILEALVDAEESGFLLDHDLMPYPLLVVDRVTVAPEHRGKGYAAFVEEKAIQSLAGLHACVASFVSQDPEFRPAALRMSDRLGFIPIPGEDDDVRVRSLIHRWEFDRMPRTTSADALVSTTAP